MKRQFVTAVFFSLFVLSGSIFSYDFKKFEVLFKKNVSSISENSVRDIVEEVLKGVLEADPYYKAITHVYSNEKNRPEFLITYLLRSDCLLYESFKINLDANGKITGVQKEFENPNAEEDSKACSSCPDPSTEVYVESSMDGTPLGAAEWVYSVALGAGYKTVKDIQGAATSARYKQFITCPNMKCVVHVGHGNNEKGILFAQDDITWQWFAALPNNYLVQQVHMYGSCLIQNDPFKSAFMGTGVEAFMAGKGTIDINTLQNTMFAIANGIFYKKEVKASFEASDARSKGWDISGNPPNGPWYVDKAITSIHFLLPRPESKSNNLICQYSKNTGVITVAYVAGNNPGERNQKVLITVYSLEGHCLANLVPDRELPASNTVRMDASKLSNGVYVVTLTRGSTTLSARAMIYK